MIIQFLHFVNTLRSNSDSVWLYVCSRVRFENGRMIYMNDYLYMFSWNAKNNFTMYKRLPDPKSDNVLQPDPRSKRIVLQHIIARGLGKTLLCGKIVYTAIIISPFFLVQV